METKARPADNNPKRLFIVDDDSSVRELVRDIAEELGYAVAEADNAETFLAGCASFRPSLVIIDLVMPDTDGVELLRLLAKRSLTAKVCVMSGMDRKVLQTAMRLGADRGLDMLGAISKPVSVTTLENLLEQASDKAPTLEAEELAQAIDQRQLTLHYQPKLRLSADGQAMIDGAEALVRWQHPQRGLLYPDAFIELAEDSGLITALTDAVIAIAIDLVRQWQQQGLQLPVAINISPQNLSDLQMPDRLAAQMHQADVDPQLFTLEITESAAMRDMDTIADILTRFRLKNIALSMDDFGTGYSSLVQLYRLPFSELKIDRSFVAEVEHSEEARIIVRSLADLARNLGLSSCAEGVETTAILDYCRKVGCDTVQGYGICKPLPAEELVRFIQGWQGL